ncbi:MAG: 50S ribosomal protein L29 [Gammaproteobacteria bacterium HGW-Gammaproteobacteria-7]|jgi:large subunit ribosomal protein L29|nr:MAG: 50S ribosomal protein L29 [Gammaproteobacteria bacterium HGW-Gammaproteobacteria-7]
MDSKTLNSKTTDELNGQLIELRKEQFALRMQKASGQMTKTHQVRDVRRNIARVKTALGAKKEG